MKQKRILITGGAGFIGSRLANQLVKNGHSVRVFDNLSTQIHGENPKLSPLFLSLDKRVEFLQGSVINKDEMTKALNDMDIIVHFAAETGTGQSMYNIQHYTEVNVGGTALMLDLIANNKIPIQKIVVASSRAIYGEGKYSCKNHGDIYPEARHTADMEKGDFDLHCPDCREILDLQFTDENTPVRPASVYGITKLNQEQMVLTVAKSLDISAIGLRYQNVYGPGQSLSNPYTGILSIFSTRIRNGSEINIFEDGKESRDFVYIDDVVDATVRAIEYEKKIIDYFNVGSGVATDVLTIAHTLEKLLDIEVPIKISGQFRQGDIRHNVADLKKISERLGFKPNTGIEQGLEAFVSWVKGEPVQKDNYEKSIAELREKGLFK